MSARTSRASGALRANAAMAPCCFAAYALATLNATHWPRPASSSRVAGGGVLGRWWRLGRGWRGGLWRGHREERVELGREQVCGVRALRRGRCHRGVELGREQVRHVRVRALCLLLPGWRHRWRRPARMASSSLLLAASSMLKNFAAAARCASKEQPVRAFLSALLVSYSR